MNDSQPGTAVDLTDLGEILAALEPAMDPERYVFVCVPGGRYGDLADLEPRGAFLEAEGLTVILKRSVAAAAGIETTPVFRCISLGASSSLEAIGLTAHVATALAARGISANVVAARFHDHVFVLEADALEAMSILGRLHNQAETR